jgi:hypothetical protein
MNWEVLNVTPYHTSRLAVPGGWLYLVSTSARETMVFVPAGTAYPHAPYPNATVAPR